MEQRVEIYIENIGEIIILSDYGGIESYDKFNFENSQINLINIPLCDNDDKIPIIFSKNAPEELANLMLLDNRDYQISFKPFKEFEDEIKNNKIKIFNSLKLNNKRKTFKPFNLSKNAALLNFNDYVGKTFLDIKKEEEIIYSLPIEVRSNKMDYQKEYPKMISDLSLEAPGIIYQSDTPLFQNFNLIDKKYASPYELFMYLEYLFQTENLPSTVEYLSHNLHSQLKTIKENVPTSLVTNIGPNELVDILDSPENLVKVNDNGSTWYQRLNGYMPIEIDEIQYQDTIDTPENRFFKYFLQTINYQIDKLLKEIKKGYAKDRLKNFSKQMEYFNSLIPFEDISRMEYAPLNSQVLQKKEGYRDLFEYFIMYEYSFKMNWKEVTDNFKGYEKVLSELYENWCLFRLIKILSKITNTNVSNEELFKLNDQEMTISLKEGSDSQINFNNYKIAKIKLFYNLKFYPKKRNSQYSSYSHCFRPDYTIQVIINNQNYFIHFDAKYRTSKDAFKEIINKMHTYKDAIYNTQGSYVLYPGEKSKVYYENENENIPSVGGFILKPGGSESEEKDIEDFIKDVFDELIQKAN